MDDEIANNLKMRIVCLPGGRDKEDRAFISVHVPQLCDALDIVSTLQYLMSIFSDESNRRGFTVILDARKCPWRVARSCTRQVNAAIDSDSLPQFIVLRPDAFWDKQRVESCRTSGKDAQVVFVPMARLFQYIDQAQLPMELNGNFIFNADQWFENRVKVDAFEKDFRNCSADLRDLQENISTMYTLSASQIQDSYQATLDRLELLKIISNNCIGTGSKLVHKIEDDNRNRKFASDSDSMATPQDVLDTIERIEENVGVLRKLLTVLDGVEKSMRRGYMDTKDVCLLEEGVGHVVSWVLGPGEELLKKNLCVGFDLSSAEELRREHECVELQCWNVYGAYAELIYKIDSFAGSESLLSHQQKDLISQKDFMDFVCRSFANRLERRRNMLIISLRFFRLVSEYFDRTGEVFDSMMTSGSRHVTHFQNAEVLLHTLMESQSALDEAERELFREGEKLTDMLSMPLKDVLGREMFEDYSNDISNIRDILDATTARKNILSDSVELQKLMLQQVTLIFQYEADAQQAIHWLEELSAGLLRYHSHVGCTMFEIQTQKGEHQTYLDTGRCAFQYGEQLINASSALRDSCKLEQVSNMQLSRTLQQSWCKFSQISQEQMTRLRVFAVFYRSVEEQCEQLRSLRDAAATTSLCMDLRKRGQMVQHYFRIREQLMVDVGRMARLGRLLRIRLKEPLLHATDEGMSESNLDKGESGPQAQHLDNESAISTIGEKLVEISALSEELDASLKSAQQDSVSPSAISAPIPIVTKTFYDEEYPGDVSGGRVRHHLRPCDDAKSDDEFLTASECTLHHSRSSSYNTASDSEQLAQWWEYGKDDRCDDVAKEKMVLAVGAPDLPLPKDVLKTSPGVPPGKVAREVTETTQIKVQQSHAFDVKSFVLTSETVRSTKDQEGSTAAVATDDEKHIECMQRLKEVSEVPWTYTNRILKTCIS